MTHASTFKKLSVRLKSGLFAAVFIGTQLMGPAVFSGVFDTSASAAPNCVVDTAGANDEPNQKDLTKLCVDQAGAPTSVKTTWNWDDLGSSGANTLDACNLFDTDGDGFINYAVCVTTTGNPAVIDATTTYSCGDAKIDRCTTPATPVTNNSSCTVAQSTDDPFAADDFYPKDTQGACTIQLASVGGAGSKLIDVCSYPSGQPNSDPSDCVIAKDKSGKLEVIKNLVPSTDTGKFNLQVDATTKATDVGNNGTTGEVVVSATATHSVGELAGTSTSLSSYTSAIVCKDLNGTGSTIASGSGTSLSNITIADGSDVVCTITNTASASITIVKNAIPDSTQDFGFTSDVTGHTAFNLDDESGYSGTQTGTDNTPESITLPVSAGTYHFGENATSGWYLDAIDCPNISETQDLNARTFSMTVAAGQNITCTVTNRQYGQIAVTKQTNPDKDATQFSINASPAAGVVGTTNRTISDDQTVTYQVKQGAYSVSEDLTNTPGWTKDDSACASLVVDSDHLSRSCTITNTKLAKLKIVKAAVPSSSQDFSFTTTGTGLSPFSLDDDADPTLPNNQQFINLAPGDYTVSEGAVSGWDLSGLTCSGASSYSRTTDTTTLNVTLAAGNDATCTFTNTQRGSISGVKYEANADGATGVTIGGVTIFIDADNNGMLDAGETSTTTANDGTYSFTNLLSGVTYHIREVLQSGWTKIFGNSDVTLSAGQNSTGNNFGNFHNGTISGYKWNDQNGNGTYDNEPKLPGWTIFIDADNSGTLNGSETSMTTDSLGTYAFTNLAPGTYKVCEVQQSGWVQTFPGNNACQSAMINVSGETETRNFGNQGHGTITVKKTLIPASDPGKFNLQVDGATKATNVGDNGTTTAIDVVAGTHSVAETAGTSTTLSDYTTTNACDWNDGARGGQGEGTTQGDLTITAGDNLVCTFTNTRNTGTLRVFKDVDLNGDGDYTDAGETGATNWQWQANSGVKHNTGDAAITVPTGSYAVSEVAQDNYHFVSLACTGGTLEGSNVSVAKDAQVVCTFKNARDTGYVKVNKSVYPSQDTGKFNLQVDGQTAGSGANVGDGGTTGLVRVLTGSHSVGETAGTSTSLGDYSSTYACSNDVHGTATTSTIFTVTKDQTVTCDFTNVRLASVTVTKDANPDRSQQFTFHFGQQVQAESLTQVSGLSNDTSFDLTDDGTHTADSKYLTRLLPGKYYLSEDELSGWDLTDITCGDVELVQDGNLIRFTLAPGQNLSCTFTNTKRASVTIAKDAQPDSSQAFNFTTNVTGKDESFSLTDNGTASATKLFQDLKPGTYTFAEDATSGWDLKSIVCSDGIKVVQAGSKITVTLTPGDDATCTFVNKKQETGVVLGAMTVAATPTPTATAPLLVNTGDNIWVSLIVSTTAVLLTAVLALATRRTVRG